jgi:uncharacterized OsmC-like protein
VSKGPPSSYCVEAMIVRPGVSEGRALGSVIEFDTSPDAGARLAGPADLLTMAFAACVLKNVERFGRILPFRFQSASISITSERQDVPPKMTRISYSLHLITDESEHRVELLHRNIRQHGTIYNTLAAVCEVSGDIVATRPVSL